MQELTVIDDPAAAGVSLDPIRARLLAALTEPGSATTLAAVVGLTRQKVNSTCARWSSTGSWSSWRNAGAAT